MTQSLSQQNLLSRQDEQKITTPKQLQGEAFYHVFSKLKLHLNLKHFTNNIKRNNINSKPIQFKPRQIEPHLINIKGIKISRKFQNLVLILDIIFTIANFFLSTFQAFMPEYQNFKAVHKQIIIINIIVIIIYFFKTIMSLISQDVERGVHYVYVTDIIKKQFVKGRFILQISLAIVIIVTISINKEDYELQVIGTIYFILCILKMYSLSFSLFKIELMIIDTAKKQRYWNLFKVFVFNLLVAHFMASIFVAMIKIDPNRNWYQLKYNAPLNPGWFQLYVWAYYWACTIMITVGFGDFVPNNMAEAAIVAGIQILSSITFAYNISQIGSILVSMHESNKRTNTKIGMLRRISKKNNIPILVNIELEQYIVQSQKIEEDFEYSKHHELIKSLPKQLQQKYYEAATVTIYRKIPFFNNLGSQTLIAFLEEQQGKVYYPGQFIIKKSFPQQICIVLKGSLGFCYRKIGSTNNDIIIEEIQLDYETNQPMFLAKNVLNRNQGVHFDVKVTKYSYGVSFSIERFIEILRNSEMEYHYYLMTLDSHQAQSSLAMNKCIYCDNSYHTKFQCPKLHFMPLKSIVIAKHNNESVYRTRNQKSIKFSRRSPKLNISHAYKCKTQMDTNSKREFKIANIDRHNFIRMIIMLFGEKNSYNKSFSSKAMKKILSQNFNLVYFGEQEKEQLQQFEILADFHHYFTAFNPQNLLDIKLSQKKKKVTFFGRLTEFNND